MGPSASLVQACSLGRYRREFKSLRPHHNNLHTPDSAFRQQIWAQITSFGLQQNQTCPNSHNEEENSSNKRTPNPSHIRRSSPKKPYRNNNDKIQIKEIIKFTLSTIYTWEAFLSQLDFNVIVLPDSKYLKIKMKKIICVAHYDAHTLVGSLRAAYCTN